MTISTADSLKKSNFQLHHRWQTPDYELDVCSHREGFMKQEPKTFGYYNSQTRLSKNTFSDRVRRDKMSECSGRKDHEGETSGSVLHV
jgi:hypothetical protein